MNQVLAIMHKDLLQWTRRPLYFIASSCLAVLIIWLVGDTFSGARNIPFGLYDPVGISELSKHLSESRNFKVFTYNSIEAARQDLNSGRIAAFADVSQDPFQDEVTIITKGHNPLIEQHIANGVLQVLTQKAKELDLPLYTKTLYTVSYNLRDFITPGLAAYLCYVLASMNLGFSWIYEWMEKTYRQIILAPNGLLNAVVAKTLTVTFQASLVLWLALGITAPLVGFTLGNNFLALVLTTLMSMFTFTCMGLGLACLLKTIRIYTMTISILGVALMFASGIVIPVEAMPIWEQQLAKALPLYYSVDAFKGTMLNTPANYGLDLAVLCSWAAGGLLLAIYLLNKRRAHL